MKLTEILERLRQPVPCELISYKTIKGNRIDYISWVNICRLLDDRAGLAGWSWQINDVRQVGNRLTMVGCLTIYGDDRSLTMMATGSEDIDVSSYGDPSSNAEAMSLRRSASKLGLARNLWAPESKPTPQLPDLAPQPPIKGEITRSEWMRKFGNKQTQKV